MLTFKVAFDSFWGAVITMFTGFISLRLVESVVSSFTVTVKVCLLFRGEFFCHVLIIAFFVLLSQVCVL